MSSPTEEETCECLEKFKGDIKNKFEVLQHDVLYHDAAEPNEESRRQLVNLFKWHVENEATRLEEAAKRGEENKDSMDDNMRELIGDLQGWFEFYTAKPEGRKMTAWESMVKHWSMNKNNKMSKQERSKKE